MNLFSKIFITISVVLLLFFSFFINHMIEIEKENSLQSLLLKINNNKKFYPPILSQSLFTFDKIALRIHLSSIYLDPEVHKIDFVDSSSKMNLKYDSKKSISKDFIKSTIPLLINDKQLGVLTIFYSQDIIDKHMDSYVLDIVEISLLFLILVFLVIFYFIKSFTKKINILTTATTQIAAGNLDINIDIKSNDEIGILADKLEIMKNSLKDRIKLIDQQKDKILSSNEKLLKSNTFLLESQSIADICSWEINTLSNNLICSDQLFKIFDINYQKFDANYTNFLEFIDLLDRERVQITYDNSIKDKKSYSIEYRIICKNNIIKNIRENCIHILNEENEIIKTIGTIQNITETKQKDNLIYQQSKMASMGEMIENIAHQWRQPLSIISAASTGIKFKNELKVLKEEDINAAMLHINDSVKHLSHTIDDFRDFFKGNKKKFEFKVNDTFEKTFKLIISQFKTANITIIKNIEDVSFFGFENELIQVLMNILNNARDELIKKDNSIERLILIDVVKKDTLLEICIKDNAGGIPKDIINDIFEPHFTTKEETNGTGIGLYMSQMIIKEHMNGTLEVNNVDFIYNENPYLGAEFKIFLPIKS